MDKYFGIARGVVRQGLFRICRELKVVLGSEYISGPEKEYLNPVADVVQIVLDGWENNNEKAWKEFIGIDNAADIPDTGIDNTDSGDNSGTAGG